GRRFTHSANRTDASRFDVYVQDADRPDGLLVHEGPGGYYAPVGWSLDDRWLLVERVPSNYDQDLYLLEVSTGKARHLTAHSGDVQYHHAAWSADGKSVYCTSTAGGRDLAALARIDVGNARLEYVQTPEHEVEGLAVSLGGRWLAWLVNNEGR